MLRYVRGKHSLWTRNGETIWSVKVLNVNLFSQLSDWDEENVILTGSLDGVVRVWFSEPMQFKDIITRKVV